MFNIKKEENLQTNLDIQFLLKNQKIWQNRIYIHSKQLSVGEIILVVAACFKTSSGSLV